MGLLSFLWASDAKKRVTYLEGRVYVLENRVRQLENEVVTLKTKKREFIKRG